MGGFGRDSIIDFCLDKSFRQEEFYPIVQFPMVSHCPHFAKQPLPPYSIVGLLEVNEDCSGVLTVLKSINDPLGQSEKLVFCPVPCSEASLVGVQEAVGFQPPVKTGVDHAFCKFS